MYTPNLTIRGRVWRRITTTAYKLTAFELLFSVFLLTLSTLTSSVPEVDRRKDENNNSAILVTVAASLAGVLFVVLIILAVVLLLRRRKRRGHGRGEYLRMWYSFESSGCSSLKVLFVMCLVVKETLKSQIICTENIYHTKSVPL